MKPKTQVRFGTGLALAATFAGAAAVLMAPAFDNEGNKSFAAQAADQARSFVATLNKSGEFKQPLDPSTLKQVSFDNTLTLNGIFTVSSKDGMQRTPIFTSCDKTPAAYRSPGQSSNAIECAVSDIQIVRPGKNPVPLSPSLWG